MVGDPRVEQHSGLTNSPDAAFVVSGLCSAAGAVGIGRSLARHEPQLGRQATGWLVLPGVGSILCGLFTLENDGLIWPHLGGVALV